MKTGSQPNGNNQRRFRASPQTLVVAVIALFCLGWLVQASGILILDSDRRFIHQRYQVYRVKKLLHLSHRDHPHFNSAVGVFLGDKWNRKYCYAAHLERKAYEARMSRKTFHLQHRTALAKDIEMHWEKLNLPPYCRFWVLRGTEVTVVVLEEEMKSVAELISTFDQPLQP